MNPSTLVFVSALVVAAIVYVRRVGFNLTGTSALLGLMFVLHGPAYLYYTRVYGPETDFFEHILSAAPGEDIIGRLDIAMALCFVMVCAGIVAADRAHRVSPRRLLGRVRDWAATPLRTTHAMQETLLIAGTLLALGVLLPFVIIDRQPAKIVEFILSDLGEFEKIALRREEGGSNVYLYNLLVTAVLPFFAYALLAARIEGKRRLTALALLFGGLVLIAKAATLSKAPPAVFLLQLVIVVWMTRSLRIGPMMFLKLAGIATGLFFVAAIIANPTYEGMALVFEFLFYRTFMIVNEGLVEYFAAIPAVIPHSWGTQLSWIAGLFSSEPRLPTYWLVGEVHRGMLGTTTTVLFMGDAWADFSWGGVIVVSFLMGLVVRTLDIQLLVRRPKSIAVVAGLGSIHFGIFTALNTSFPTALLTGGLLLVLPLVSLVAPRRRSRRKPGSAAVPDTSPSTAHTLGPASP
jgi:hypothetical protein